MLTAERLCKHYDTARGPVQILRDVSLTVDRGEAVAIMGPSGCGKSTLLYLLGALEPPSSGTVRVDGTDPYALSEADQAAFRGSHIGFVFQDHLLLPQLTAQENVLVPTLAAKRAKRLRESFPTGMPPETTPGVVLLARVGLADRVDHHRPGELSGGERQRVAIARALVRKPSLILCDEPTGNLDRSSGEAVADLLLSLASEEKAMLIVVTHNAALAARFARRYEIDAQQLRPIA